MKLSTKLYSIFFIFLSNACTTSPHLKKENFTARNIASADYYEPRDIQKSPYRIIKKINYDAIKPILTRYISSQAEKVPFQNQDERWSWAVKQSHESKNNFSILPLQSIISNQALLENKDLLKKIKESKGSTESEIKWLMENSWFATTPSARLFAYKISQTPEPKPTILIWAKEHGDELSTSEFTTHLAEFFLHHLKGNGEPDMNKIIKELFAKLDIVIVPDMTPNKNFQTFQNRTCSTEDYTGWGNVLQPFNYDSNDSDDYVLAPEAAFLKKIMSMQHNYVLGIDIHTPFGVSVIAGPDDSVAENNRYLIAEGLWAEKCAANLRGFEGTNEEYCKKGSFLVAHPQISGATQNAPSYFSRINLAPSILLELERGKPDYVEYKDLCDKGLSFKEKTCFYYPKEHLKPKLPYFLRIMEIIANTNYNFASKIKKLSHRFTEVDESKKILISDRSFFSKLSPVDVQLRMKQSKISTTNDLVQFVSDQALTWEIQEVQRIKKLLFWIEQRLSQLGLDLNLPTITFIKTTGKEEADLPYTRGNSIVLPINSLSTPDLVFTLSHELFHIYSRNNPQKRDDLYHLVGFKKIDKSILNQIPEKERKITNPDVDEENVSINVLFKGQSREVIPCLRSRVKLSDISQETSFAQNIIFQLWSADSQEPFINVSLTNYNDIASFNSNFNFHPEEILADNFATLLTMDINKVKHRDSVISLLNYLKK